jgi:hypothetical protein
MLTFNGLRDVISQKTELLKYKVSCFNIKKLESELRQNESNKGRIGKQR